MTDSANSRLRRWTRSILINGALLTFSLLLAAGVGELAIRLVAPQQLIQLRPDLWQPVDTVGYLHRPDVATEINTGEGTVHVFTDHEGFRVGEAGRVEEGVPVLVLGDSYMEALQVEYEESFAGRLQQELPAAAGVQVAVRNAGIDGWNPSQYLLRARSLLDREDYQLVIVGIYLGNDVVTQRLEHVPARQPAARHRFRFPRRLTVSEIADAALRPINDVLEVRSQLYVFVKNRLANLRMKAGLTALYFPEAFLEAEAATPRWAVTADICRDIAELAAAHGAQTLFVLIPTAYQVDAAEFDRYVQGFDIDPESVDLDQPNRLLGAELRARGLRYLDVLPVYREAHQASETPLYGSVDPHFTAAGHALLSRLVSPRAAELLRGGS